MPILRETKMHMHTLYKHKYMHSHGISTQGARVFLEDRKLATLAQLLVS